MKKPEKGWKTPNAWLLWKMQDWTLEQTKTAFLVLIPILSGGLITQFWNAAMHEDGYYGPLTVPSLETDEPDVEVS